MWHWFVTIYEKKRRDGQCFSAKVTFFSSLIIASSGIKKLDRKVYIMVNFSVSTCFETELSHLWIQHSLNMIFQKYLSRIQIP